jgi:hypothetical protein
MLRNVLAMLCEHFDAHFNIIIRNIHGWKLHSRNQTSEERKLRSKKYFVKKGRHEDETGDYANKERKLDPEGRVRREKNKHIEE